MSFHHSPPSSPTPTLPSHLRPLQQPPASPSIPPLSSQASSTLESESLASPLRRLSVRDDLHLNSSAGTRKPIVSQDCAIDDASNGEGSREIMLNKEYGQDQRCLSRDVGSNAHREASPFPFPLAPSTRPPFPHRVSSYSKRHASFDSPIEVPLPYMPHRQPSYSASTSTAQTPGTAVVHDSESAPRLSCIPSDSRTDTSRTAYSNNVANSSSDSSSSSMSSPPTSIGGDSKGARSSADFMDLTRDSTSSMHFHSSCSVQQPHPQSPRIPSSSSPSSTVPLFARPVSSPDASRPIHSPRPMRPPGVPDRGSTASLPLPADTPYHTLPPFPRDTIQEDQEMRSAVPTRPNSSRPTTGPNQGSTSPIPSSSSWQTRRSPSFASDLEHEEFMSLVASRILDRAYSSVTRVSSDGMCSIPFDRPLPPPAPPTVLTPPPLPLSQDRGPAAPYEPFLAHAPAPRDSHIVVDTKPAEYRLIIRLPGFSRDAITVSTRKRRILHIVADSWEANGSHFEQRISFGYDALLAQVRAEFDGEHLRVIVPRRTVPMTYQ